MLTEPGGADYPLPDRFKKFRVVAMGLGENWIELTQISPSDMASMKRVTSVMGMAMLGMPVHYAVTDRMEIWPAPTDEWEIARCYDVEEPCHRS